MCFKNLRFFYPSDPKMTPFLGSKSKIFLSGAGFSPKPTPGPNFIEIGVGVRTLVSRSLVDGLLKDLTRVSSLDSCPDKSGRNRGLSYSSEDTFLRNCTKMQLFIIHPRSSGRAKINDEKHGAFCPHGCHLE